MSTTTAPLRIEIIDPIAEPLDGAWAETAVTAAHGSEVDEWLASMVDAWTAAGRHLDPVRRSGVRWGGRIRRIVRVVSDYSIQVRTDGNPRRGSLVRQHLFEPFDIVAGRLPDIGGAIPVRSGSTLELTSRFTPLPGGGRQAEAALSLRGSWPRLPLVLKVEPWWRNQSVITVELRTRRRVRYPRRYFRTAHATARRLGAELSSSHRAGASVNRNSIERTLGA
jgi:hypothetical protein